MNFNKGADMADNNCVKDYSNTRMEIAEDGAGSTAVGSVEGLGTEQGSECD